jgi:hypothetical protein
VRTMRLIKWRGGAGRPSRLGSPVADLQGTRPDGTSVEVAMDGRRVVLFFLTSSCYGCRALWDGFAARPRRPEDASVVLVTPSASTESAKKVVELDPGGLAVVMSSDAWHTYGVTSAPWCIVVAGGVVVADGTAPASWNDVEALLAPPA